MAEDIKGIEEGRAIYAYRCVESICKCNQDASKAYRSYAKRIPAMIKINGLGPTIAFMYSKGNDTDKSDRKAYNILYKDIEQRLKDKNLLEKDDKLVEAIINVDTPEYMEITIEVLAFFSWLRRFAEGMIGSEVGA